jgi:hypothetical protein
MTLNNRLTLTLTVSTLLALIFQCSAYAAEQANTDLVTSKLVEQNQLKMSVSISEKTSRLVAKQQVSLHVKLLSTQPFKDNFTLPYFDIDNAVVIPPSDETKLEIQTIEGQQWFVQHEIINIYPITAGTFTVPALTAEYFINGESSEVLTGKISSKAITFSAELPVELNAIKNFIASPSVSFTLKQSQAKSDLEQPNKANTSTDSAEYTIGSAVTFTYSLKADYMHVIMLDKLAVPKINGIKIYQKPAVEKDVFDRFEKFNAAQLTQEFTFIFQEEGTFTVPAQQVTWWDLTTNSFKEITIKAKRFKVGQGVGAGTDGNANSAASSPLSKLKMLLKKVLADTDKLIYLLVGIALLIFCIAVIRKIVMHRSALLSSFHKVNKTRQKQIATDFTQYIAKKDYQLAINSLYQLTEQRSGSIASLSTLVGSENQTRLNTLQQLAFHGDVTNTTFTEQDSELLLSDLLKKQSRWRKKERFKFSENLNPNL